MILADGHRTGIYDTRLTIDEIMGGTA